MEAQILFEQYGALRRLCLNGPNVLEVWRKENRIFFYFCLLPLRFNLFKIVIWLS